MFFIHKGKHAYWVECYGMREPNKMSPRQTLVEKQTIGVSWSFQGRPVLLEGALYRAIGLGFGHVRWWRKKPKFFGNFFPIVSMINMMWAESAILTIVQSPKCSWILVTCLSTMEINHVCGRFTHIDYTGYVDFTIIMTLLNIPKIHQNETLLA